jgi:subtilisin family serine protease
LQAGDAVPAGVSRIEAATAAGVPFVASSATAGSAEAAPPQLLVAVMDSGVDAAHPDLNYAGGVSFATPAGGIADDASPGVDVFGHGSHVAGIIGARNNGVGVVGVSPGVPLFSVKVLNGAGMGMLSDVLSALAWVTAVGVAQGIRVINLSVAAYVDPATPRYQDTFDLVCGVMKGASDAGVVVSAAAGNYGSSLAGYFPAVCPTVAAVAALDGTGRAAAPYSNYVAAGAPAAQLAHMLAAPGSSIRSTVPRARDASGYAEMSGTSMAAPHVAGVAANCILSGACAGAAPAGAAPAAVPSSASSASASSVLSALSSSAAVSAPAPATGVEQLAVLQAAAQQRYAAAEGYGFAGDATSTAGGRYMGYLVWAGAF